MKTNEEIKEALLDLAEKAVEELVGHIEDLKEGDLDQLEQTVFKAIMEFGRTALEELLRQKAREEEAASPAEGSCGHTLRLVSYREKQVNTVMGPLTIRRAYYHCQEPKRLAGRQNPLPACPGVAPFDQRWGLVGRRSSPGVRRLVSFLSARLAHEEVAETLARLLSLAISARQVGHVIQPAGEAFRQFEDQQVQKLLTQGAEKHRSEKEHQEEHREPIRRLYVEMDGVMARLRRGSVPYVARRTTAEEFAPQLYTLARHHGLSRARQVVTLRDSWAQAAIDHLSEGKVEQVIAAIEQLPPLAPEPGKTRGIRETEADYFGTNMPRMRYPVFRAQGIHLGSGIAEAACKTVVATRTKRSGMRWTPQGLDAILALRTAALNQEFDQSWQACREAV